MLPCCLFTTILKFCFFSDFYFLDPFSKSQNGDDALTTACLNGSQQIFDLLKSRIKYSSERIADAHELIGSTFLDEHNETRVAILHWRLAHHTRLVESISKC